MDDSPASKTDVLDELVNSEAYEPPSEAEINALVNNTPVLVPDRGGGPGPDMPPQVLWAFCIDCAQNIKTFEEIAVRYGFVDGGDLKDFLVAHKPIRRKIKELRAVWESDDNLETRVRKIAGHAMLEAIPETAKIMLNPRLPDSVRMDAFSRHAKVAGVEGNAYAGGRNGAPGPGRFSVSINFTNAGSRETFTTVEGKIEEEE